MSDTQLVNLYSSSEEDLITFIERQTESFPERVKQFARTLWRRIQQRRINPVFLVLGALSVGIMGLIATMRRSRARVVRTVVQEAQKIRADRVNLL